MQKFIRWHFSTIAILKIYGYQKTYSSYLFGENEYKELICSFVDFAIHIHSNSSTIGWIFHLERNRNAIMGIILINFFVQYKCAV